VTESSCSAEDTDPAEAITLVVASAGTVRYARAGALSGAAVDSLLKAIPSPR